MSYHWIFDLSTHHILFFLISFVSGSVPYGLLIARAMGKGDVRSQGSGNIGATNVARVAGKKGAALTFIADFLKGFIPTLAALSFFDPTVGFYATFGAILGHVYSPFLRFKGGKGLATMCGCFLALFPGIAGLGVLGWIVTFYLTRISSLSALVSLVVLAMSGFVWGTPQEANFILITTLFIAACHHENIYRLCTGSENTLKTK